MKKEIAGMDDSDIVELFFDRSEQAISETGKKYGRYCYSIAYNILHNREDAEECVNDTWLRTWNSILPKRPCRLQTYLGKITRHLALNKLEKSHALRRGRGQVPLVLDELAECIPDARSSADPAEDIFIRELLDRFLADLPVVTRNIFVRRYWYMSSVKEIAREYHLTESNVTVTLFRTRKKLKKYLEKEGIDL